MQRLMNAKVEDTKLNAQIVMKLMVPLRPALSSYITGALGLVLQFDKGSVCVCVTTSSIRTQEPEYYTLMRKLQNNLSVCVLEIYI